MDDDILKVVTTANADTPLSQGLKPKIPGRHWHRLWLVCPVCRYKLQHSQSQLR
ncbi:MAG: hypothetical protein WBB70_11470 [Desulfobacterales bacterium]